MWIGISGAEASEVLSQDPETLVGYSMIGSQRAMFANRLSFFYDLKGEHCRPGVSFVSSTGGVGDSHTSRR